MSNKFQFVGYWDGNESNPVITSNIDVEDKNKKLCLITIEEIPDSRQLASNAAIVTTVSKLTRELKNLKKATKQLK